MRFTLLLVAAASLAACGQGGDAQTTAAAPEATTPRASAAAALPLDANGAPRFRPGLWETTKTSSEGVEKTRQCLGQEANAEIAALLTREDTPECKSTRTSDRGGLKVVATCVQSGVKIHTELVLRGSETEYEMRLKMGAEGADGEVDSDEIVGRSRWIGACPADMSPGDEIEVE